MQARWSLGVLGILALAGSSSPAGAQAVGFEFQVNTYTTSNQNTAPGGGSHLVAADASGNFVIVWGSRYQDGSTDGIFGQRYDSAGAPQGGEFRVNSYTTSSQRRPSVASDANGNFVVVWSSYGQDGSGTGVFGQRYDSAGAPQGGEFQVNSFTTSNQLYPSVASDANGNFVVVWQSYGQDGSSRGVFGQRYDSAGAPLGGEFRVNSYTTSSQVRPSAASDANGNFVVVWDSYVQDGSTDGIFGQRYDSAGAPQGGEFRVNSYTTSSQLRPSAASDGNGNFVVVWTSYVQDGSGTGVFGQRYDSAGAALGTEFRVNSFTLDDQSNPSVVSYTSGDFVVAWNSRNQDGSSVGVFAQRYDSAGVAQGNEFQINSFTTGYQRFPSVGVQGTEHFVVVWDSYQDGSQYGVFGRRLSFSDVTPPEVAVSSVVPDPTNTSPIPVTVEFSENVTGFVDTDIVAGNASVSNFVAVDGDTYTFDLVPSGQGLVTADIAAGVAQDGGGNPNTEAAQFSRTFDSVAPSVSMSSSAPEPTNTSPIPVTAEFSENVTGFVDTDIVASNATVSNFVAVDGDTYPFDLIPSGPGPVTADIAAAVAQDAASNGNSAAAQFSRTYDNVAPSVTVGQPNGGERLYTGSSYLIQWSAADNLALSSFDVFVSVNGGGSYAPIAECQDLSAAARTCVWLAPGPPSNSAFVRVTAEDTAGNSAKDVSNAVFTIVSGTPSVTVTNPNANLRWRIGSFHSIQWTHNLSLSSTFRIELDRNNDGVYEELIAAAAPATAAKKGSFVWTVTGPPSGSARVRVSWTSNLAVSDSSDVTFQIRP